MTPTRKAPPLVVTLAAVSLTVSVSSSSLVGQEERDADLLHNARSAAPAELAHAATVRDWSGHVLQEGDNGWVCYPDAPDTPRNDPMCLDRPLQELLRAWQAKDEPRIEALGFGYMLQGGGGESGSQPYADHPDEVDDWIVAPPHLLVVIPDPELLEDLPDEPGSGGPWVMWKGTPYVHVMVPTPRRIID